ncbi:MAG: hypothetical protein IJ156_03920 [Bacteroidales bacterium]|nr:hypothetical protein [Bacteroidales bacterium]
MKRVLAFLTLLAALFLASACHYNVNLSVDAWTEIAYENGDVIHTEPVTYEGFHRDVLTDSDLERIFIDLTQHVNPDFKTAVLHLSVFDEITDSHLRDEDYGVVYNSRSGHYDFADLNVRY